MSDATTPVEELRRKIRDGISTRAKPETEVVEFFGEEIELRQPPMRALMDLQSEGNNADTSARMILTFCYVPGTDVPVFDDADIEWILSLPFGKDMAMLTQKMSGLTSVDISSAEKNSEETPS